MNEAQAYRVMMTAPDKAPAGSAVITRDVAESTAKEATVLGRSKGYPPYFTTEKEKE